MSDYSRIDGYYEQLRDWRQDFHRHPELAFEEERTSGLVAERLESFGIEVHRGLGRTGVVGTLRSGSSDRCIGLRADMDALPIHEENGFGHRSTADGKMHACGHDGHTTMLLGAARYLAETKTFDGTVRFIFQPAEEAEGGARVMIEEGLFEQFPVDKVFGVHNYPGMAVGDFALCEGPMMAAIDVVSIDVVGRGGHAAFPQLTVDPLVMSAQVLLGLQTLVSRTIDPRRSAVVSITQVQGGTADNVTPDKVWLGGCVRTFLPEVQDHIEAGMKRIAQGICEAAGGRAEVDYRRFYPATVNSAAEVGEAARAAADIGENVDTELEPIMGSEDFSFMLQKKPGAFLFLGNGPSGQLHTPNYDFNDDALTLGAKYWARLVESLMPGESGARLLSR